MGGKKIKVCKQTIYAFLLLMCLIIAYAYESTMVGSGVLHNKLYTIEFSPHI